MSKISNGRFYPKYSDFNKHFLIFAVWFLLFLKINQFFRLFCWIVMNRNLSESYCYSVADGKHLEFIMTDFIAKNTKKENETHSDAIKYIALSQLFVN